MSVPYMHLLSSGAISFCRVNNNELTVTRAVQKSSTVQVLTVRRPSTPSLRQLSLETLHTLRFKVLLPKEQLLVGICFCFGGESRNGDESPEPKNNYRPILRCRFRIKYWRLRSLRNEVLRPAAQYVVYTQTVYRSLFAHNNDHPRQSS